MFKRLSIKLALYIMLILILIVGGASVIYVSNSKSLYVNNEKQTMENAFKSLTKINFSESTTKIDNFLENYGEQAYDLLICNNDLTPVYSTKRSARTVNIIKNQFVDKINEFKADNQPVFENGDNREEQIVIRTKINNFGKDYYLYIRQSLRTSDSVFKYTNGFLIRIIIAFIILCGAVVLFLINRTTKSLRKLSEVAAEISKGDYSVRYDGKISKDEIGVLANNLNFMADTIAENVNNLNNYNFLLKEDNSRMTEYENMRKRVLTNITHELKTPLAIISSQIEMMNCTKDNEKKIYYYESALEEIDKMSKLISRLLNFSAGEKVIFENQKKLIDLDIFINNLCNKSQSFIISRNIILKKDIIPFRIEASPDHVEHIFNNYLMNAIQFSPDGGLIKISIKPHDNFCRLSVFNKGSFVKEEDSEKIWTDFYKSISMKDDTKRTGIGLFIVKEISLINHEVCGFINHSDGVEFWYDFKK